MHAQIACRVGVRNAFNSCSGDRFEFFITLTNYHGTMINFKNDDSEFHSTRLVVKLLCVRSWYYRRRRRYDNQSCRQGCRPFAALQTKPISFQSRRYHHYHHHC